MITQLLPIFKDLRGSCCCLDNRYRLYMTLGKGRHARVKLAFDERSKEHVAIKMVPRDFTELQVSLILNEVKALKYLGEGLFTPILDFNFTGEVEFPNGFRTRTVYYTMPLQENGEFYQYIENGSQFDEATSRLLFRDLLCSVQQLHHRNIAHRDIKTENILMTSDFQLRICDFGSSTFSQNSSQISKWQEIKSPLSAVGSPEYNAPEIIYDSIEHDKFSLEQADVFSLACAMFLMVVKSAPFGSASLQDPYYKRLLSGNVSTFWKIFDPDLGRYSSDFKDLFEKMTKYNPNQRITLDKISEHSWLANGEFTSRSCFVKEMQERSKEVLKIYMTKAISIQQKLKSGKLECKMIPSSALNAQRMEEFILSLKPSLERISKLSRSQKSNSNSSTSNEEDQKKTMKMIDQKINSKKNHQKGSPKTVNHQQDFKQPHVIKPFSNANKSQSKDDSKQNPFIGAQLKDESFKGETFGHLDQPKLERGQSDNSVVNQDQYSFDWDQTCESQIDTYSQPQKKNTEYSKKSNGKHSSSSSEDYTSFAVYANLPDRSSRAMRSIFSDNRLIDHPLFSTTFKQFTKNNVQLWKSITHAFENLKKSLLKDVWSEELMKLA